MKSFRKVLAGAVLAGGALLATAAGLSVASAQDSTTEHGGGGHWGHHPHGGPWGAYHKLGLTDAQKASIKALFVAAKPQWKSLHEQSKANREKLAQAVPGSASYTSVVAEVAQSNATLASQRTTQGAQLRAQMYAVLTPAQQSQLASLQAEWQAKAAARAAAHASAQ